MQRNWRWSIEGMTRSRKSAPPHPFLIIHQINDNSIFLKHKKPPFSYSFFLVALMKKLKDWDFRSIHERGVVNLSKLLHELDSVSGNIIKITPLIGIYFGRIEHWSPCVEFCFVAWFLNFCLRFGEDDRVSLAQVWCAAPINNNGERKVGLNNNNNSIMSWNMFIRPRRCTGVNKQI